MQYLSFVAFALKKLTLHVGVAFHPHGHCCYHFVTNVGLVSQGQETHDPIERTSSGNVHGARLTAQQGPLGPQRRHDDQLLVVRISMLLTVLWTVISPSLHRPGPVDFY
jgi:hypothetical protein